MKILTTAAATTALALVAGCATFAPEPCTDRWYQRETREAFAPVRRDLDRTIRNLRAAAKAGDNPGVVGTVRLVMAAESAARLLEGIERESLPRLRATADYCDDPAYVRRAFFDFLDEEGIDELEELTAGLDAMLVG
jgi:hypothetical protein